MTDVFKWRRGLFILSFCVGVFLISFSVLEKLVSAKAYMRFSSLAKLRVVKGLFIVKSTSGDIQMVIPIMF